MWWWLDLRLVLVVLIACSHAGVPLFRVNGAEIHDKFNSKSGLRPYVDPDTPEDQRTYTSSRGDKWELVMSDEYNTPKRSFKPKNDHIFTSLSKPDGVNSALHIYRHDKVTTACDDDDTCYLQITAMDKFQKIKIWTDYKDPPGYEAFPFYYESAMVQSWNKFCYQGGMMEVRAQLPGAISPSSGNPDLQSDKNSRVSDVAYYPTWPGIWLMGNLGRAIFSASTKRMWPFSYDECNDNVFNSSNQRISACNDDPGFGLRPNQGRGAPEIDILEGGGETISTSIQVAPGMPVDYRVMPDETNMNCVFTHACTTQGANAPDLPTALYKDARGHKSWYQGLRYGANNFCAPSADQKQSYDTVKAAIDAGITDNTCTATNCPGSYDPNADISAMDGRDDAYWGINSNGTCYPIMNGYSGDYLCSLGNKAPRCVPSELPPTTKEPTFAYQMDAISSNWPIHVAAYTGFVDYQLEWVTGRQGYVRWMLSGQPVFEIPAKALEDPPQDTAKSNPKKIMIEEPMYLILNVQFSKTWNAKPPNPGQECRGDGSDDKTNKICDSFPMYMKIDYIRLYQDVSDNSTMNLECSPKTHPTAEWIKEHAGEYSDDDNPIDSVSGKGLCKEDDDCSRPNSTVATGACRKGRCMCRGPWAGPRCTMSTGGPDDTEPVTGVTDIFKKGVNGEPPFEVSVGLAIVVLCSTIVMVYFSRRTAEKNELEWKNRNLKLATGGQRQESKDNRSVDTQERVMMTNGVEPRNARPPNRAPPPPSRGKLPPPPPQQYRDDRPPPPPPQHYRDDRRPPPHQRGNRPPPPPPHHYRDERSPPPHYQDDPHQRQPRHRGGRQQRQQEYFTGNYSQNFV